MKCKDHPLAPHGFNREASLANDDYVCDCDSWSPPMWYEKIGYETYISGYKGDPFITLTDKRRGFTFDLDIREMEELIELHKVRGRLR